MAGRAAALYRLQLVDTEIEHAMAALARVEGQLGQDTELLAARRKLTEEEESLGKTRGKLRTLELDLDGILSKISSTQAALYGGEVTNPKELAGLQQEVEYLERHRSEMEDDILEAMADAEDATSHLQASQERLQRMEEDWNAEQEGLRRQAGELRARLAALKGERKEVLLPVSERDLAIYEDLRRQKGGQAVALLEGGICQGCRVALPTSLVQKVRRGQDLVQCGSCQRILNSARQ
jgi:predicted  nucleic acid-binding Zn-ribbon protein